MLLIYLKKLIRFLKLLNLKIGDRVRILKFKNIFSKGYTKKWPREIFVIDSILKTNPWTYKSKDINKEKIKDLMKKNCCRVDHKQVIALNHTITLEINQSSIRSHQSSIRLFKLCY